MHSQQTDAPEARLRNHKGHSRPRWLPIVSSIVAVILLAVIGINWTPIPDRIARRVLGEHGGLASLQFERAQFAGIGGVRLNGVFMGSGTADEGGAGWQAKQVTVHVPLRALLTGSGPLQDVLVVVNDGMVTLDGTEKEGQSIPFQRARFVVTPEEGGVLLSEGVVEAGEGTLYVTGRMSGDNDNRLDLSVEADKVTLPSNLALLQNIGMTGRASFQGRLTGPIATPTLEGDLTIADGSVWFVPVKRAQGTIQWGEGTFSFQQSRLEGSTPAGTAIYDVEGVVVTQNSPTRLNIGVEAIKGRIEDLLTAFRVDDADALKAAGLTGQIDGVMDIVGTVGQLSITGNVAARHVQSDALGDIDYASAAFSWSDGGLHIAEGRVRDGGGEIVVQGGVYDETIDAHMSVTQWPLDRWAPMVVDAGADGLDGVINLTGHLSGPWDEPRFNGQLAGGRVQMGSFFVDNPRGAFRMNPHHIALDDVTVGSVGDGTYRLSGEVTPWRSGDVGVNLDVSVEKASLSALLATVGMGLPSQFIDGDVTGHISLAGSPVAPDATFDLYLGDERLDQAALHLAFSLDQGRLRIGSLPVLLGSDGLKLDGLISSGVDRLKAVLGGGS